MTSRHLISPSGLLRPLSQRKLTSIGRSVASRSLSLKPAAIAEPRIGATSIIKLTQAPSLRHSIFVSSRCLTGSARNNEQVAAVATQPAPEMSENVPPPSEISEGPQSQERKTLPKDGTFASMKGSINYDIWKALTVKPFGYTNMSAVQESVLHLLPDLASGVGEGATPMPDGRGRDLLVKAKTGTGKTIAFLVPAIEARYRSIADVRKGIFTKPWQDMLARHRANLDFPSLDKHGREALVKQFVNNTVGALILSPTRELATQIADEAQKLLTHNSDMRVQLLVGGANRQRQIDSWRKSRPDIVVATPGRILDLLNDVGMIREAMTACRTLVLDEADTLLEMGFRDDLQAIMQHLPAKVDRQNMLFSATVSPEIKAIARASLEKDHRFIDCVPAGEENVHQHIPQFATVLESAEEQIPHVLRLIAHDQLSNPGKSKVIVFAPTTKMTELFSEVIRGARRLFPGGPGSVVYEIHSKKDQRARFTTSDNFRKDLSGASILVTSDVSARGVDYPGTTRVIQIGVPSSKDTYIHRIGRTGRAGAQGRSDIVLSSWERGFLHFQLDDLPVKQLSSEDLVEEVQDLCKRFDESPQDFEVPKEVRAAAKDKAAAAKKDTRKSSYGSDRRQRTNEPVSLRGPLTDKYLTENLSPRIKETLQGFEGEEIRETFVSLLGYYGGRIPLLRASKSTVLDGLKKWTVEAAGLEREPYISDQFLNKIGYSAGSSSSARQGYGGGRGDGQRSFGRGRFNRDNRDNRDDREFNDSRGGRESRGFRGDRDDRPRRDSFSSSRSSGGGDRGSQRNFGGDKW